MTAWLEGIEDVWYLVRCTRLYSDNLQAQGLDAAASWYN